jgi:hypothetical protein
MKMRDSKIWIRKIPLHTWILLLIVVVGIFLRTYHFRDWLVFNPDQARDATVIENVLDGKKSWLMLGPEAGNTRFDLGPWFYHLEVVSAKIFGNAPDKMAYPDLLFSILAIPLFYVFMKKYFPTKLSLALTGLLSVSFFAVRYSRFAWNPNSIPFFVLVFLLGILYLLESEKRKSLWGAVMIGTGIGVGIQLHILLFFIMPTVAALFFLFLFFKKVPIGSLLGKIGIVLLLIAATNAGQIAYELNHGNSNTRKFMKSTTGTTMKIRPGKNLELDFLCQAQANLHIISSLGNADECDFSDILTEMKADSRVFFLSPEKKTSLYIIIVGTIFSLAGYILLIYFWRKETDWRKRNFLALVEIFGLVTLAAMFPVSDQAEPRYHIVLFFLPFVFAGIIFDGLLRFRKIWSKIAVALLFALLFWLNGSTEAKTAENFSAGKANTEKFIFLGETEKVAKYLIDNAGGSKTIYLRGEKIYDKRYFKSLNYILASQGYDLARPSSDGGDLISGASVFFVVKTRFDKYRIGDKIGGYSRVAQLIRFGDVTVIVPSDDEVDR